MSESEHGLQSPLAQLTLVLSSYMRRMKELSKRKLAESD